MLFVNCDDTLIHVHKHFLFAEYTAAESVCVTVHGQDLWTANNRPLYFYATTCGKTHQTEPFLRYAYTEMTICCICNCNMSMKYLYNYTLSQKNETLVILNVLYICKSTAVNFSM